MRTFTHAITRQPSRSFVNALSMHPNLPKPNYERALQEHTAYTHGLEAMGLNVIVCPADERFPDGNFVEDTFLILNRDLLIELNPGAKSRAGEPMSLTPWIPTDILKKTLSKQNTMDGGDVLVDGKVIYVGLSKRTQSAAVDELEHFVKNSGYDVVRLPVPEGLHLKSGMTALKPNHFIIQASFLPVIIELKKTHPNCDYFVVPANENHAANVLPVNGKIMIPMNCPETKAYIQTLYPSNAILEMDTSEVQLVDGALTCGSLLFNSSLAI